MKGELHINKADSSYESANSVAELIVSSAEAALSKKGRALVGLCGGRSVKHIYERLSVMDARFERIFFFLLDERLVSPTDEQSNFRLINDTLLSPLQQAGKISNDNIIKPDYSLIDRPDEFAASYSEILSRRIGEDMPGVDCALYSMGEDGHVASIFPGHVAGFESADFFFAECDSPKAPSKRLSISAAGVSHAGTSVLLAFGASKRAALSKLRDEGLKEGELPAKLVLRSERSELYTDMV